MKNKKCCTPLEQRDLPAFFKALSDTNRIQLLGKICELTSCGKTNTNLKNLSSCCEVDLSVVSRHLKTLERAHILSSQKKGKEVFYKLNGKKVSQLLRELADFIDNCSC